MVEGKFETVFIPQKMAKLLANSGGPDQAPRSVASDLGLHCLPFTLLGVSRLQRVNCGYEQEFWDCFRCVDFLYKLFN